MRKTNTNLSNYDDFLKYSLLHNVISGQEKTPETISFRGLSGEAQTGFEPVDTGVADHCLTTWLLRHYEIVEKSFSDFSVTPTGIEPVLPP